MTDQLLEERGIPELAHLVLLGVVFLLVWGIVPMRVYLPWAGAVTVVVGARGMLWQRARRLRSPPRQVRRVARVTMVALGLAWGIGTVAATPYLPAAKLAVLVMALAGLLAGGITTLMADRWLFPLYAGAMLGPVLVGVVRARERFEEVTVPLILIFLVFTIRLHKRAHAMLVARLHVEGELRTLYRELQTSVAEVKVLHGILPICATCKRIKNEAGGWEAVESFVRERTDAEFSHGLCPDCAARDWGAAPTA